MPTISSKKSLGSIFGGQIASINYNFQTSSEPSTATLTVVSENDIFTKPEFNELVSIPPFGIKMLVTERSTSKDSRYSTLQIELVDSTSSILDKELVLIFGEHTDLKYTLNNDLYYVSNSVFVPKSYFPPFSEFNKSITFPNLQDDYVKSHGNGINVIGTARATYVQPGSENITGKISIQGEPYWITFQSGEIKEDLSSYEGNFVLTSDLVGNVSVNFGYTLRNLHKLIKSKGLSFDSKSENIMFDENIFFAEVGTIREVLSSCLSKIGRSFYIDPFSQKIVIISNADVAKINTNLYNKFSSFSSVSGATQISLKESISDVEATHFVLKGDLNFIDNNQSPDKNPKSRKQVLYKLDSSVLTADIKEADVDLIKRVAPIVFTITDQEMIDRYIFALGIQYPTENWGELYGEKDYRPGDFEEKSNGEDKPSWQTEILEENLNSPLDFGFYDPSKTVGARPLYRESDGEKTAKAASEADFYQNVKDFTQLWAGTYFSAPMTQTQIDRREYQERAKWMLGLDNSFDFIIVNGESYIQEVPSLQFLVNLLKRSGSKTNYKVKEIASKAYKNAIGEGDYFVLGLRKLFFGSEIKSDELYRLIGESFWSYFSADNEKRWLLYTKNGQDAAKKVEKACLDAFEDESKKVKEKLVVRYIVVDPTEDPDEDSNQEQIFDTPNIYFLRNIPSNVSNFSRRSLNLMTDRYSEIKLFLDNIGELNPEFSGPLISTQINYFRPPTKLDFNMEDGVESVSVSISDQGVTTNVSYSSRKFAQIDLSVVRDFLGGSGNKTIKGGRRKSAYGRNQDRE